MDKSNKQKIIDTLKAVPIAGPSGVGKTTCVQDLLRIESRFAFSVSATTRPKRDNEIHGVHYFFITADEFKQWIAEGKFVEYEEVYDGIFYGTLWSEIERVNALNKICLLDIDVKGMLSIKKKFEGEAFSILLTADVKDLETRLRGRKTESDVEVAKRVAKAEWEIVTALNEKECLDLIVTTVTGRPDITLDAVRKKLEI
jgi:guanylate kinase